MFNITVRNPGAKKAPQESACPTPSILHTGTIGQIQELIDEAVMERKQSALKLLVRH
jgi:hypothetical protein